MYISLFASHVLSLEPLLSVSLHLIPLSEVLPIQVRGLPLLKPVVVVPLHLVLDLALYAVWTHTIGREQGQERVLQVKVSVHDRAWGKVHLGV